MDLINFEEGSAQKSSPMQAPLVSQGSLELSPDFSNPMEAADQLAKSANDPFESLGLIAAHNLTPLSSKDDLKLWDGTS